MTEEQTQTTQTVNTPVTDTEDTNHWYTAVASHLLDGLLVVADYVIAYAFYVVVLLVLAHAAKKVYTYVMSLWVQGDLNEWVVITRGGEPVQAGIGLSCFKGPFDTVAIFPSKLTKVEVKTQQITQEMQGVQVNSMLEWTINREGNGPMKAFQNLGLATGDFRGANETLRDLTSAIVRHQIANSTIDTIIKNREKMRDDIIRDISAQAKGWGVHLATVEITDVRILSQTLFNNMQTQFREENNKKATIERLEVKDGIWREEMAHSLTDNERYYDALKVSRTAEMTQELMIARERLENKKKEQALQEKEVIRMNKRKLDDHKRYVDEKIKQTEIELRDHKKQIEASIRQIIAQREVDADSYARQMKDLKHELFMEAEEKKNQRDLKKEQYDLEKSILEDPIQAKLRKMEAIKSMYANISVSSMNINSMGKEDPMTALMNKFTSLVQDKEENLAISKTTKK